MRVRRYRSEDVAELWDLFFHTIRRVNSGDYSDEQVRTWAPDDIDVDCWQARIDGMNPFVCVRDGVIVGYAGLLESGYVDHFYVHHAWQRHGIGTRLMEAVTAEARAKSITELSADVSITARPFFESHGFRVVTPQDVTIGTVVFRNYKMTKPLDGV